MSNLRGNLCFFRRFLALLDPFSLNTILPFQEENSKNFSCLDKICKTIESLCLCRNRFPGVMRLWARAENQIQIWTLEILSLCTCPSNLLKVKTDLIKSIFISKAAPRPRYLVIFANPQSKDRKSAQNEVAMVRSLTKQKNVQFFSQTGGRGSTPFPHLISWL